MNMNSNHRHNLLLGLTATLVVAFTFAGHAANWGSVRGNNRSSQISRAAPPAHVETRAAPVAPQHEGAAPNGYVVVAPPIGATVPELPPGAETIVAGGTAYYYAGGAFYVQTPQGYAVVAPPPGLTVTVLPPDAVSTTINGMLYYAASG